MKMIKLTAANGNPVYVVEGFKTLATAKSKKGDFYTVITYDGNFQVWVKEAVEVIMKAFGYLA